MKSMPLALLLLFLFLSVVGCEQQPSAGGRTPTVPAVPSPTPDLYVSVAHAGLYALDANTGKTLWHNSTPVSGNRPVVSGNTVYLLDGNELLAFNVHTGKLLWQFSFGQDVQNQDTSTFLIGQHAAYILAGSDPGATAGPQYPQSRTDFPPLVPTPSILVALDLTNGKLLWQKKLSYRLNAAIIESDTIYGIGSTTMQGVLYALKGNDGSALWQHPFAQTTSIYYSPVIASGMLYLANMVDGSLHEFTLLYAFSLKDGSELWNSSQPMAGGTSSDIAFARGVLYFFAGDHYFYAVKAQDGTLLWSRTLPFIENNGSITVSNGQVYLLTQPAPNQEPATIEALNASTGQTLWSHQAPQGADPTNPLLVSHHYLYLPVSIGSTCQKKQVGSCATFTELSVFDQITGTFITSYALPASPGGGEYHLILTQ